LKLLLGFEIYTFWRYPSLPDQIYGAGPIGMMYAFELNTGQLLDKKKIGFWQI